MINPYGYNQKNIGKGLRILAYILLILDILSCFIFGSLLLDDDNYWGLGVIFIGSLGGIILYGILAGFGTLIESVENIEDMIRNEKIVVKVSAEDFIQKYNNDQNTTSSQTDTYDFKNRFNGKVQVKKCPQCSQENPYFNEVCLSCGYKFNVSAQVSTDENQPPTAESSEYLKKCPRCGSKNLLGNDVCWKCGYKFK